MTGKTAQVDRLVGELRLAGAATLAEANAVVDASLPHFNTRFAVPPTHADPAWRPLRPGTDPWQICCFRYVRTVGRDETVRLGEHCVQLLPPRGYGSLARRRVEVREHVDGSLSIWYQGQPIATQPAPREAPRLRARSGGGTRAEVDRAALAYVLVPHPHQCRLPARRQPIRGGAATKQEGDIFSEQLP